MKYIDGEMTVKKVVGLYPFLMSVFKKYGLAKFEDPEVLNKLGGILKLKTALSVTG
jgi:hypothetical protein